ncbi:MAG: RsmB/NOP family class I SAM-dependent RNA methyltransferase [Nitratireductor sp.]
MAFDSKNNHSKNHSAQKQGLASRYAAVVILGKIVDDHQTIDQLCDPIKGLKEFTQLEMRDQALARAIVITTLRHYSRIGKILSKVYNRKPPQKARILIHAIEVGAAQILFMDVPTSAAVNLSISIIKNNKPTQRFSGFANAVLRNLEREKEKLLEKSAQQHPFPQWLFKKLCSDHGKEKTKLLGEAFSLKSNLDITLKSANVALADSIEAINLPTGSLRLTTDQPIQELEGFDKGDWWIQDISASLPAKLIGDVAGKQVADLCAAPGGKTMQLAASGANVTAIDISEKRLELLKQNLERTGLNAKTIAGDILDLEIENTYDAILLDAPCSATGTGRRHPDVLWNKTPQSIEQLVSLQRKLIEKAASMLKENGVLIYANCSLLKDEGENLIAKLAIENLSLDPIQKTELSGIEECVNGQGVVRTLPHFLSIETNPLHSGMDGFFIARFKKCTKPE